MEFLLSIIVVCIIIFLVITLLPVILTGIVILAFVVLIFVWYLKRKIRKQMKDMQDFHGANRDESFTFDFHSTSSDNEDIIDVEFVEREDIDK